MRSGLSRIAAASLCLLGAAGCVRSEPADPAPTASSQSRPLMRGYTCTPGRQAGSYSCTKSLTREEQREATGQVPEGRCPSCGAEPLG